MPRFLLAVLRTGWYIVSCLNITIILDSVPYILYTYCMTTTYSVTDLREHLSEALGIIRYTGEVIQITHHNSPVAFLVPVDASVEDLLALTDEERQRVFAKKFNEWEAFKRQRQAVAYMNQLAAKKEQEENNA